MMTTQSWLRGLNLFSLFSGLANSQQSKQIKQKYPMSETKMVSSNTIQPNSIGTKAKFKPKYEEW